MSSVSAVRAWILVLVLGLTGCATSTELGLLQHAPANGTGGSLSGHWSFGAVPDRILAVGADVRADLATGGDRFAIGGSVLGGLPVGRYKALARAGVWHAVFSNAPAERSVVPSLELSGYIPLNAHREPDHPEHGASTAGVVIGVREDLDSVAYTTVFRRYRVVHDPGLLSHRRGVRASAPGLAWAPGLKRRTFTVSAGSRSRAHARGP